MLCHLRITIQRQLIRAPFVGSRAFSAPVDGGLCLSRRFRRLHPADAVPVCGFLEDPKEWDNTKLRCSETCGAAKGLASLGVAAAKIDLAAESALSIPVTGPLGAVGAA